MSRGGNLKELPVNVKRTGDKEHPENIRKALTGGTYARMNFDNEVLALLDTSGCEHVVDFKGKKKKKCRECKR